MTQDNKAHPKRWFGTLTHNGQKWAIVGGDDAVDKAKAKFGPGTVINATGCVGPLPVYDVDREGPPAMDRPKGQPVDEIERQNAVDEELAKTESERQRAADARMASRPKWGFGMVRPDSQKPKRDGPPAPDTGPEADAKRLAKFANVHAPSKPDDKGSA